jgi:ATP-dependent Lon protease
MPASRWYFNLQELGQFNLDENNQNLREELLSLLANQEKQDNSPSTFQQTNYSEEGIPSIPDVLPILPLRGLVVFPQTGVPLTIGQPRSIQLVDEATAGKRMLGLLTSKNPDSDNPDPKELNQIGTVAVINRLFRATDGTIRLLIQGLSRFKIVEFVQTDPYLKAKVEVYPEKIETGLEVDALARSARDQFEHIAEMIPSIPRELVISVISIQDPLQTVYTISNFQRMELAEAQEILELDSISDKLKKLVAHLTRESEVLELGQKIQNNARNEIEKVQREYFLREQLKAIQKELGESDEQTADVNEFKAKIETLKMPEEAEKQANRELERLSRLPTAAADYGVIRSYLEWLVSLPWSAETVDDLDIGRARKILDQDHFGLKDVKQRILEYLAVRKLRLERKDEFNKKPSKDLIRKEREGVILCFIGPPGVGKTSLGQSISRAMGRKFIRISLGGVRDEAEIRGHRRTYIGALPGRIIQAIRRVESRNPVFMMDEIDKLSFDFHGDPASALLEVLDPEQNNEFRDNYIEVPFDLSQVMFITTANSLETIPAPLLDRMEVIQLAGYTENEKIEIAKHYLIPRQLRENGLRSSEIKFTTPAILAIIRQYTRESGVRNLEREIASVCRKVVTQFKEGKTELKTVKPQDVRQSLGHPKFMETEEIIRRTAIPGVATGLAWTPSGGEILFIEATKMTGSKGFQITGSIGTVMQESAQAALSYVRSKAAEYGIDPDFYAQTDIHLHIPSGAQPKDGPSAGVTMVTALVSLLSQRLVRADVAMTGEISLSGQVLPIGGLKEKVLAAHRAGLKTVIIPKQNLPDIEDLPKEIKQGIEFIPVETIGEVLINALEKKPAIKSRKKK